MGLARRTELEVVWSNFDISQDLAPYLIGLTYTDHLSGTVDDLSLDLQDRDGLWSGDWRPAYGDIVVARIQAEPWLTDVEDLRLGTFSHDKISHSGPPKRLSIQSVSAALATGLRRRKRTRAWASVTLRQIAQDIATRAGLTLDWTGANGRTYPHRKQKNEGDLEFLEKLCKETGRALKVTETKIVIFGEYDRDLTAPVGTIDLGEGHVLSWNFDGDDSDRYGACRVSCKNPHTGKQIEGTFTDTDNPDGQTLEVVHFVSSIAEAEELAEALLRQANRFATRGTLTTIGDPGLVAGVTFDLAGAYGFDGRFIITKAEHRTDGGYTCTLDVRRTLENY